MTSFRHWDNFFLQISAVKRTESLSWVNTYVENCPTWNGGWTIKGLSWVQEPVPTSQFVLYLWYTSSQCLQQVEDIRIRNSWTCQWMPYNNNSNLPVLILYLCPTCAHQHHLLFYSFEYARLFCHSFVLLIQKLLLAYQRICYVYNFRSMIFFSCMFYCHTWPWCEVVLLITSNWSSLPENGASIF